MVQVDAWLAGHRDRALMILQVHDELVFEAEADFVPTLLDHVPALMAGAAQLRVPLVVDSGWAPTGTRRTEAAARRPETALGCGFRGSRAGAMNHS